MAVCGIDLGCLNSIIAQAGNGGIDIVLNDSSNRQSASFVSIQGKQRYIGDSAAALVYHVNHVLELIVYF